MIPQSTHAKWFLMLGLLEQLRPWISDSKRTWTQFRRSCPVNLRFHPDLWDDLGWPTTAKPALTYAMRWIAILSPWSAERLRILLLQLVLSDCYLRVPFREHRICCSLRFQQLQPAAELTPTAPATWLFTKFRPLTCARDVGLRYSADLFCCRVFKNALRLPSGAFPYKAQLALVLILSGWRTRRLTPPCSHRMKPWSLNPLPARRGFRISKTCAFDFP